MLIALIDELASMQPEVIADARMETIRSEGLDDIKLGLEYYQMINMKESLADYVEKHGQEKLDKIKFSWVVSSDVKNEFEPHEVPKTDSGGVGAMC